MKKTVVAILLLGALFNASAQIKKDTVFVGDSVTYPKLYDSVKNYYFCNYKGKKIRAAKKDSGKKCFIIYNNAAGERRISKIYYKN